MVGLQQGALISANGNNTFNSSPLSGTILQRIPLFLFAFSLNFLHCIFINKKYFAAFQRRQNQCI
jgi:hypothetical protein